LNVETGGRRCREANNRRLRKCVLSVPDTQTEGGVQEERERNVNVQKWLDQPGLVFFSWRTVSGIRKRRDEEVKKKKKWLRGGRTAKKGQAKKVRVQSATNRDHTAAKGEEGEDQEKHGDQRPYEGHFSNGGKGKQREGRRERTENGRKRIITLIGREGGSRNGVGVGSAPKIKEPRRDNR